MLSPPHAEIPLEPLGIETNAQPFERCFQLDLDLSLLDLHLDQLHPNRALA